MRLRVVVYLRPKTVKVLLARKDKTWGGQKWMAEQMGVSEQFVSAMLSGMQPVPSGRQGVIINLFRGMGLGRGQRLSWDLLFQQCVKEMVGTETAL